MSLSHPSPDDKNTPTLDEALLPTESQDGLSTLAESQFVHGLLEHLQHDSPDCQHRRVAKVLQVIRQDRSNEDRNPIGLRIRYRISRWSMITSSAAAIMLIVAISVLIPSDRTALAVLQETITATELAGDRSYRVFAAPPGQDELDNDPHAWIDIRDKDHLLLRAVGRNEERITMGRNHAGSWNIRKDGSIDLHSPDWVWPDWVDLGERSLLTHSVDGLLTKLPNKYTLSLLDNEFAPDQPDTVCDHILATGDITRANDPHEIELWIEQSSRLVVRMELRWSDPLGDKGARRPRREERINPPHVQRSGDHTPPPHPADAPPGMRADNQPPPPKAMVFVLIAARPLPESWFDPETHRDSSHPLEIDDQ